MLSIFLTRIIFQNSSKMLWQGLKNLILAAFCHSTKPIIRGSWKRLLLIFLFNGGSSKLHQIRGEMAEMKPQHKGTKQLFKNPVLEKLSRTHISVPLTIFFLYSAGLLYWSITHTTLSAIVTFGFFLLGLLFFT